MAAHDERDLNLFDIKTVYMTLKNSACKSMCCCNECSFQILNVTILLVTSRLTICLVFCA